MANNVKVNFNNLSVLGLKAAGAFDDAVGALAHDGEAHAKSIIKNSPPTGKSYTKPSGDIHVASSPGNPPRIDDAILVNSINAHRLYKNAWVVATDVEYAINLEFGTSKMEPRPFMAPTAAHLNSTAKEHFVTMFKELVKDYTR